MNRRRFVGLSAVAAVFGTLFSPGAARAQPTLPGSEPAPILTVPDAMILRARDIFDAVRTDALDRSQLDPQLNALLTDETLRAGAELLRQLGEPTTFTPIEIRLNARGEASFYRVAFALDTLTWVVRFSPDGLINGFALRRSPREKLMSAFVQLAE